VANLAHAESLLDIVAKSRTAPAAVDLLIGPAWCSDPALGDLRTGEIGFVVAGVEGTEGEVRWMVTTLAEELSLLNQQTQPREVASELTEGFWQCLTEFQSDADSALVLKIAVPPSRVTAMIKLLFDVDPRCLIQAHAGNGIIVARFAEITFGVGKVLIGSLQPAAQQAGGHVTVLRTSNAAELTHQAAWGSLGDSAMLGEAVKREFDPYGLLNPGRF
jgi:hypothetical protein